MGKLILMYAARQLLNNNPTFGNCLAKIYFQSESVKCHRSTRFLPVFCCTSKRLCSSDKSEGSVPSDNVINNSTHDNASQSKRSTPCGHQDQDNSSVDSARNLKEQLAELGKQEHQLAMNFKSKFEDLLFDMMLDPGKKTVTLGNLISHLQEAGLREDDPRLTVLYRNAYKLARTKKSKMKIINFELDQQFFRYCIKDCLLLVRKAMAREFVIPDFQEFSGSIKKIFWASKGTTSGKVADYIPQLSRYTADQWGMALCTVDGQRFAKGHCQVPFSLQSCSKPLAYALAVDELGAEVVHHYVGMEPSGESFNQLKLDPRSRPHNPMVNAGAILVASLISSNMRLSDRFDHIIKYFKRMAGKEYVGFNNSIFLSERETADRNFALSYYMKERKCFPEGISITENLDLYFQLCSVEITCDSGSVIAATLANDGVCPLTGERVVNSSAVCSTLTLMSSCGMYDYSGQFAFRVGLPCKSGVSGAFLLVVPNVMGICLWSPPLDSFGNSVRGLEFCKALVNRFNFHHYNNLLHTQKQNPRLQKVDWHLQKNLLCLFAAKTGDLGSLTRMSLTMGSLDVADYDGRTPLHLAASEGHLDCVKFLVEHANIDVKSRDRAGRTPKDEAERFGHKHVIKYLQSNENNNRTCDQK